jgi:hypothetical protein
MRNSHSFRKLLGTGLVLFVLAVATHALMIKIPLERLVNESEAIVIGKVQSVRYEWSLDKRLILTVVTVRTQETMRGDLMGPEIILEFPGGTMGDLSLKVTDMPSFTPKEEVLIFLRAIQNIADTSHSFTVAQNFFPSYEVFGKAQGKCSISADGMATKSGYEIVDGEIDSEKSISLESLKKQIKTILRELPAKMRRKR